MPRTDEATADRRPAARPESGAAGSDAPAQKVQALKPSDWTPPVEPLSPAGDTRYLISDFCAYLESYLPPEQISECYHAYLFGAEAHEGQKRKSGEPYIYHPLAVARILAEMRMDYQCLIAALLHDVIEDTPVDKAQLAETFSEEVAELVDGVSKLTKLDFKSRAEAQAASLQKMLLAMTRDIRVILIKLADRLHNMRTLDSMSPEACRRISRETLDIFAPIANRLGINWIRIELEDLGFAHYWPWRRRVIQRALQGRGGGARVEMIGLVETALRHALQQEDIEGRVEGRQKHLYGIYRKMRDKSRGFSELADVFAFRVTVDRVDTCYRVLGLVHNLYKPVPGRFKDYIAIPKANGYQSLHTALIGPQGIQIEIQIRTEDMQRLAESGIAAHWMYKNGVQSSTANPAALAADWLQNLLEMQRDAGNSVEFLEHVKVDLFPGEVYVFTPKGRIHSLKRGATVVDFAYAIHSDVGNTCVAARIDRRMAQMRTEGVEFHTNAHVGVDIPVSALRAEYDALVLAGGAEQPRDLPVPGRELQGIHFAMDFLRRNSQRVQGSYVPDEEFINAQGKHVLVIGGGDTGSDCIGTSNRHGAASVTQVEILDRPPEKENKALTWPNWPNRMRTSSSQEEGCTRMWNFATKGFVGDDQGRVKAVKYCLVRWEKDAEGRWRMEEVPGSEGELKADLVLLAMGFVHPVREGMLEQLEHEAGLKLDGRGNVQGTTEGSDAYKTTVDGVFCAATCAAGSRWSSGPFAKAVSARAPSMNG